MQSTEFIVLILAGLWAAVTAQFNGNKLLNEVRDAVATGILRGEPISVDHRRHLLWYDWLPINVTLLVTSFVLGAVTLASPLLLDASSRTTLT